MPTLQIDARIERFSELVAKGVELWIEAGDLLCQLFHEDNNVFGSLQREHPWMTTDVLNWFLRIGRREVYPYLLLDQSPGARELIRLDYDTQRRVFDSDIDVATSPERTEKLRLSHLTPRQARLVFSKNGLRTVGEQREYLAKESGTHRHWSNITRGRTTGAGDHEEIESLDDEAPLPTATHLATAQAAMIKARLSIPEDQLSKYDPLITRALNAIGELRFALNNAD